MYFNVFSNFYITGLEIDGVHWKSAEHYYQAAKFSRELGICSNDDVYEAICNAETARQAKEIADANFSENNRWQWHHALRRYIAITRMLNAKYAAGTCMRELLEKTGDLTLFDYHINRPWCACLIKNFRGIVLIVQSVDPDGDETTHVIGDGNQLFFSRESYWSKNLA